MYKQAITYLMLLPTVQIYIVLYEWPLICIHWLNYCEQTRQCALHWSQVYIWLQHILITIFIRLVRNICSQAWSYIWYYTVALWNIHQVPWSHREGSSSCNMQGNHSKESSGADFNPLRECFFSPSVSFSTCFSGLSLSLCLEQLQTSQVHCVASLQTNSQKVFFAKLLILKKSVSMLASGFLCSLFWHILNQRHIWQEGKMKYNESLCFGESWDDEASIPEHTSAEYHPHIIHDIA